MKSKRRNELTGDTHALLSAALWSIFPILVVYSSTIAPPIFFASISYFVAGIFLFLFLYFQKKKKFLFPKEAFFSALLGFILIVILYFPLIYYLGQKTSSGNLAILLQSEILFNFVIYSVFGFEKIGLKRTIGGLIMLTGVFFILLKNFTGNLGTWDFYIVCICLIPPIGNYYQKKAVLKIPVITYVCFRSLFGGIVLLGLSLFFEKIPQHIFTNNTFLFLVLTNGIVSFGISKLLLMSAYKKIGVVKSLSIYGIVPLLTLLFSYLIFFEIPTIVQWIGTLTVLIGVPLVLSPIKNKSFSGKTIRGDGIGTTLGFPTINIQTQDKIDEGVFAVHVEIFGKLYSGILHSGSRPTLGKMENRTEVHLFDFSEKVPEKTEVLIEMLKKIRNIKTMTNINALQKQIQDDIEKAKQYF